MCGAFYVRQSPTLAAYFGLESPSDLGEWVGREIINPRRILDGRSEFTVFRPTDRVLVIVQNKSGQYILQSARWWLLMKSDVEGTLTPHQEYATFNSRIDKVMATGRTLHNTRPKSFRVLIPASGYYEWLGKVPYAIERADGEPILFGAMAKAYPTPEGGYELGVSIVTLPGHPKLAHIHPKSLPLMIEDNEIPHWLDRTLANQHLHSFATPMLKHDMNTQPKSDIKQPELFGELQRIAAD
ncbi:SOS response-associated peptidase family protein [Salinispirillum marinum]|uniref:Abasic site processing protein n=2 Tax=Saccharospirillaceae TaxID=255527 RepID=A0ABV8BCQ7_9GAMM